MAKKSSDDSSKKTEVFQILFDLLYPTGEYDPATNSLVTNKQVVAAINKRNELYSDKRKLSPNNPANFLKDLIRKKTCNTNWPRALTEKRITARQRYGGTHVFEFVPFKDGDNVPFEDRFDPVPNMETFKFESLSIPLEARELGRPDEPWLIQVVVSQRIVHQHFAVVARKKGIIVESLAHLQVSVKTQPEIDATFVASVKKENASIDTRAIRAYVTCEAKQIKERILEDQIREQIAVAFKATEVLQGDDKIDAVIPMIFQVVDYEVSAGDLQRGIYVAQFGMVMRADFDPNKLHDLPLEIQSCAFYEPLPPIKGISKVSKPTKPRKPARAKSTSRPKKAKRRKSTKG